MAVNDMINLVKPYYDDKSGQQNVRRDDNLLSRRLYLMNLPYNVTTLEIEKMVKAFAPFDDVVLPRDHRGMTKGYAFVYLKNKEDVDKAIEYIDGRHIR
mmetsp:Transcript_26334/g.25517  ORF Transcript_26334/g.25517 Transcript_26334/m.25517 type:complete len:99 (+) Transcript_26334:290-586(+)